LKMCFPRVIAAVSFFAVPFSQCLLVYPVTFLG